MALGQCRAAGPRQGDPIALAEARARTFGWRRKAFLVSTPTISGRSRIEREYAASDQRRFFVPCPHCGEMQWLRFERLRWEKGEPRSVRYYCETCDDAIEEHHKTAMLAGGSWHATATAEDPYAAENASTRRTPVTFASFSRGSAT
jgi:phage terminase large subunit GpA-like protein